MAHDVFISHAHADKTIADMVCATFEQQGLRCWIAPRDIRPGADWGGAIVQAIRNSRVMVLVFSDNANWSRHIPRELERAIDHGIPIVPFRIESVPPRGSLEYSLSSVHWLDAVSPPVEAHIKNLAQTVRAMLDLPPLEPPAHVPPDESVSPPHESPAEEPDESDVTPLPRPRFINALIVTHAIGVVLSLYFAAAIAVGGALSQAEGFGRAALVALMLTLAVFEFVLTYGLLRLKPIGRTLQLIQSWIALVAFPVGTLLGAFCIRYFRKPEIEALFADPTSGESDETDASPFHWPLNAPAVTVAAVLVALIATAVAAYAFRRPSEETLWSACADGSSIEERLAACVATVQRVEGREARPEMIAVAYRNLGIVQMQKELNDEALLSLGKSIRLDPQSDAFVTRAQIYIKLDDPINATRDYNSAIKLRPANSEALFRRGYLFAASGYDDGAIQDWTEGLNHVSGGAGLGALENLGHAYFRRRDYDRALEFYARAIEIDAQNPRALFGRGAANIAKGETATAFDDIARATKLETDIGTKMATVGVKPTVAVDAEPAQFSGSTFSIGVLDDLGLMVLQNPNNLTAADVISAQAEPDERAQGMIALTFTPEGEAKMKALTNQNIGRRLGFMIDGAVDPAGSATIDSVVSQGAQIGFPSVADAEAFVTRMKESQ